MKSEPVTDMNGTPGFAGHGPGQQGLAGAGRADQQHALRDFGTDLFEAGGRTQEVDDFPDLHLDAVIARDVGEGRPRPFRRVDLGPAPADRHYPAHLALGAPRHPEDEDDEERPQQDVREQAHKQLVPGVVNDRSCPLRYCSSMATWLGSWSGAGPWVS